LRASSTADERLGDDGSGRAAVGGVLGAALGLVAVGALPSFLTGSLAPEIRDDFALGDAALGAAVGTFFIASAVGSAPCGRLVARIGTTAATRLAAGLATVCALSIAALAHSAVGLATLLLIGGLSNALASPAASGLISRDLAPERHGVGYGALTAGAPVSSLLAGLALPLIANPFGWRVAFLAAAGLALAAGLAAGRGGTGEAAPPRAARVPEQAWHEAAEGLNAVHLLAVAAALASAASTGLIAFLVVFSIESGMSSDAAGALLALTGLTAAASRIGLGAAADKISGRATTNLLLLLGASCVGFLLLLTGEPALIAAGALAAGGVGWGWTGLLNLIAVREARYAPEEAVGITMSGVFPGALVGPILVGLTADGASFDAAWLMTIAFVIAASVAVAAAAARSVQGRASL
jgi:predicted MFS family arabinose efflux permease